MYLVKERNVLLISQVSIVTELVPDPLCIVLFVREFQCLSVPDQVTIECNDAGSFDDTHLIVWDDTHNRRLCSGIS